MDPQTIERPPVATRAEWLAARRALLAREKEATRLRDAGWRFPWVSSGDSDFNYDFHVSFSDERGGAEYNYTSVAELRRRGEMPQAATDMPGFSVFVRDGDDVFHTYSTYQRGVDIFLNTYNLLDLTPSGRAEARPMQWVRHRDRYAL